MPNGEEEVSGYVMDQDGRVFFFWTGWDQDTQTEILKTWCEEQPESWWAENSDYRRAREWLGLPNRSSSESTAHAKNPS